MMRAVISVTQRGKLPFALLSTRGIAQNNLRYNQYIRPLVRFASSDNKIKGSVHGNPAGIIGDVGASSSVGRVGGRDTTAFAQAQPAALATEPSREDDFIDRSDKQSGNVVSQKHSKPSKTDCGKIRGENSAVETKMSSKKEQPAKGAKAPTSGSSLANDTAKQLQEIAANLPSKEQVEKTFFRVVAFLYDIALLTGKWSIRFIDEKILQNNTVKYYWKRFHEKMEQAKKD